MKRKRHREGEKSLACIGLRSTAPAKRGEGLGSHESMNY